MRAREEEAGESCECLKWNVIRASERRAASEQKALAPHLLGRPIPDRCGAIGSNMRR